MGKRARALLTQNKHSNRSVLGRWSIWPNDSAHSPREQVCAVCAIVASPGRSKQMSPVVLSLQRNRMLETPDASTPNHHPAAQAKGKSASSRDLWSTQHDFDCRTSTASQGPAPESDRRSLETRLAEATVARATTAAKASVSRQLDLQQKGQTDLGWRRLCILCQVQVTVLDHGSWLRGESSLV